MPNRPGSFTEQQVFDEIQAVDGCTDASLFAPGDAQAEGVSENGDGSMLIRVIKGNRRVGVQRATTI